MQLHEEYDALLVNVKGLTKIVGLFCTNVSV